MRSAIFIDLQSTVFDSHTYYLKLLNKIIEKNKWKIQLPHYVQYQLLDFYQLYFQFIKINHPITKTIVYLKEQNKCKQLTNAHIEEELKNTNIAFFLEELRDLISSNKYRIYFLFYDKWDQSFFNSLLTKEKQNISFKNREFYYQPKNNEFNPTVLVDRLAKLDIPTGNLILMSNNYLLMRYFHAIGAKTTCVYAKPDSLETYVADVNIKELLTTNLMQIIENMHETKN